MTKRKQEKAKGLCCYRGELHSQRYATIELNYTVTAAIQHNHRKAQKPSLTYKS